MILRHASCSIPKLIAALEDSEVPSRRGVGGSLKYKSQWLSGDIALFHRLDIGDNYEERDWMENFLLTVDAACA